ncbi:MAG TPA: FliG C-terminal domain-containing protein, partial [Planctomycetaceae bacterium]|nr:FliG C-terminal domain-containing protein [Planctomycetaceae bacterium]
IDESGTTATAAGSPSINGDLTSNDAESDAEQNDEADEAEDANSSSTENEEPEPLLPRLTGDPLLDLHTLSIHQLSLALSSEQPKTCAILLSNLPAKLAGDILSLLKPDNQKLVMKELTKEQHAPGVLVERIAKATFIRASQLPADPPDTRDHADRVAEVLRSVPKAGRRNMLAVIEEQDPDLAKSLLTRIYRFDDIATLGKTVIQRVLGEIDSTNLTTALYQADQAVTDAIFSNLSKRARQTIEEEMQFMSNVSESRIKQARDSIAEIIAKIDMESES